MTVYRPSLAGERGVGTGAGQDVHGEGEAHLEGERPEGLVRAVRPAARRVHAMNSRHASSGGHCASRPSRSIFSTCLTVSPCSVATCLREAVTSSPPSWAATKAAKISLRRSSGKGIVVLRGWALTP